MTYQQTRDALADDTTAYALAVARELLGGRITQEDAVVLLVARFAVARARARVLAEQAVRLTLSADTGRVLDALGTANLDDESTMLARAAVTVTGKALADASTMPVERLAGATVLEAAERSFSTALDGYASEVDVEVGWRRRLSAGACELCQWLDTPEIMSPKVVMHHHTGCRCEQEIVYKTEKV